MPGFGARAAASSAFRFFCLLPCALSAWSPASAASAEHRPVLVDFTAAWCITCQLNRKLVLDSAEVRNAVRASGTTMLAADWTSGDPQVTAALQSFGRDGVPLYVVYDRRGWPTALPQILTAATVIRAVRAAGGA